MKLPILSFRVHRWIGLAFGLFGLMWFFSVVPMSLFPYWFTPEQTVQLRALGSPLSAPEVDAIASVMDRSPDGSPVATATLHHLDAGLVWRLALEKRGTTIVDTSTGRAHGLLTRDEAARIATRALEGRANPVQAAPFRGFTFYWTVPASRKIPPYRVIFDDASATDVFINAESGDVERLFGTGERLYRLGRTPHLLRFPPFDDDRGLTQAMRLGALCGLVLTAIAGFVYRVWLVTRQRRQRAAVSDARPWSGRWLVARTHTWIGVTLFIIIMAWGGSGFLMLLSTASSDPSNRETARLRGDAIRAGEFRVSPGHALRVVNTADRRPVMQLKARRLLDRPVYEAVHADSRATIVDGITGEIVSPLSRDVVETVARRFVGKQAPIRSIDYLDRYDAYYYSIQASNPQPLPVWRVTLDTDGKNVPSLLYIDANRGEVYARIDSDYKLYRWLGRAPHTFDFPWFIEHPRARRWAVAIPGMAGTVLSASGIWLGLLHLIRVVRSRRAAYRWNLATRTDLPST